MEKNLNNMEVNLDEKDKIKHKEDKIIVTI